MIAGFTVRQWCTSHACSDWIRHQKCGRHVAVGSSAGLLRRCPEFQSGQLGQRVGDSSKRCEESWDGAKRVTRVAKQTLGGALALRPEAEWPEDSSLSAAHRSG